MTCAHLPILGALGVSAVLAGCAIAVPETAPTVAPSKTTETASGVALHIAQLGFGDAATFALCATDCPTATRKTVGKRGPDLAEVATAAQKLALSFGDNSSTLDVKARARLDARLEDARRADRIVIRALAAPGAGVNPNPIRLATARAAAVKQYIQRRIPDLITSRFDVQADERPRAIYTTDGHAPMPNVEVSFIGDRV